MNLLNQKMKYFLITSLVLVFSCNTAEEVIQRPEVSTKSIDNITGNSAEGGGLISFDGGGEILSRGVCWSLEQNPIIKDSRSMDGQGKGEFISNITGLEEKTKYYVRAYATNSAGTSYGENVIFTTLGRPEVTIQAITDITRTSANIGATLDSDGGLPVTSKGICWSESHFPTTDNNKIEELSDQNIMNFKLEGLLPNSTFYVRAFATNQLGTSYGEEVEFTTYEVLDTDGNGYHAVTIGSQVWLTTNLKVTKYRNGDAIPNVPDPVQWGERTSGAYCDYDNDPEISMTYGKLYNWHTINDERGLAPEGWRVASNQDWNELINFLGGEEVAGGKMKQTGTDLWISPNTGASNESGFTAIPGGARGFESKFGNLGNDVVWWTSTETGPDTANGKYLTSLGTSCYGFSSSKTGGSYIRCIKE